MQQIWKDINGYQGLYQVSNMGRIKSLVGSRQKILKYWISKRKQKHRTYNKCMIDLCKNKIVKHFIVSRLVYSTFKGQIPQNYHIDHIDNNPQNNRLDNLQCLSASENMKKVFVDNPKLAKQMGKKIICLNNGVIYDTLHDAAKQLNIDFRHMSCVLKGKRKHTCGYSFKYYEEQDKINNLQQLKFDFI